jgi:hypothetical protein
MRLFKGQSGDVDRKKGRSVLTPRAGREKISKLELQMLEKEDGPTETGEFVTEISHPNNTTDDPEFRKRHRTCTSPIRSEITPKALVPISGLLRHPTSPRRTGRSISLKTSKSAKGNISGERKSEISPSDSFLHSGRFLTLEQMVSKIPLSYHQRTSNNNLSEFRTIHLNHL